MHSHEAGECVLYRVWLKEVESWTSFAREGLLQNRRSRDAAASAVTRQMTMRIVSYFESNQHLRNELVLCYCATGQGFRPDLSLPKLFQPLVGGIGANQCTALRHGMYAKTAPNGRLLAARRQLSVVLESRPLCSFPVCSTASSAVYK